MEIITNLQTIWPFPDLMQMRLLKFRITLFCLHNEQIFESLKDSDTNFPFCGISIRSNIDIIQLTFTFLNVFCSFRSIQQLFRKYSHIFQNTNG